MKLSLLLPRLLPRLLSVLAVLSLLAVPVAAPSVATAMAAAPMTGMENGAEMENLAGMSPDMSCCSEQQQSPPGCEESCPTVLPCSASCFPNPLVADAPRAAIDTFIVALASFDDAVPERLGEQPPPRPPRS